MTRLHRRHSLLVLTLLATQALAATSNPETQRVGTLILSIGDALVAIPSPVGFEEATSSLRGYENEAIALTSAESRLLAAHLRSEVVDAKRSGRHIAFQGWTYVRTPRAFEEDVLTPSQFSIAAREITKAVIQASRKSISAEVGPLEGTGGKLRASPTDHQPTKFASYADWAGTITFSRPSISAEGRTSGASEVVTATNIVYLKGKIVYFSVHANYVGEGDRAWVQKVSEDWVRDARTENR